MGEVFFPRGVLLWSGESTTGPPAEEKECVGTSKSLPKTQRTAVSEPMNFEIASNTSFTRNPRPQRARTGPWPTLTLFS